MGNVSIGTFRESKDLTSDVQQSGLEVKSYKTVRAKLQLQVECTRFSSNISVRLNLQLLPQQRLESLAVFGEFFDPLVELVEGHGVLKKGPSELGLIVNERNLGDGSGGSS